MVCADDGHPSESDVSRRRIHQIEGAHQDEPGQPAFSAGLPRGRAFSTCGFRKSSRRNYRNDASDPGQSDSRDARGLASRTLRAAELDSGYCGRCESSRVDSQIETVVRGMEAHRLQRNFAAQPNADQHWKDLSYRSTKLSAVDDSDG